MKDPMYHFANALLGQNAVWKADLLPAVHAAAEMYPVGALPLFDKALAGDLEAARAFVDLMLPDVAWRMETPKRGRHATRFFWSHNTHRDHAGFLNCNGVLNIARERAVPLSEAVVLVVFAVTTAAAVHHHAAMAKINLKYAPEMAIMRAETVLMKQAQRLGVDVDDLACQALAWLDAGTRPAFGGAHADAVLMPKFWDALAVAKGRGILDEKRQNFLAAA